MIIVAKKPLVATLALCSVIGIFLFMSFTPSNLEYTPLALRKFSEPAQKQVMDAHNAFTHAIDSALNDAKSGATPKEPAQDTPQVVEKQAELETMPKAIVKDDLEFTETPFMPKMANETLKAQLGNAAWKLFHTILARYPDKPSKQERLTLQQYILLFAQVYPCGDCARHFQQLLAKYPPQTGSRKTAALWGCDIHNKVNDRLKKPEYDCSTILEDYDCGCGDDEKEEDSTLGNKNINDAKGLGLEVKKEEKQLGG